MNSSVPYYDKDLDGFVSYVAETEPTPQFLIFLFVAYVGASFLVAVPLVLLQRKKSGPEPAPESALTVGETTATVTATNRHEPLPSISTGEPGTIRTDETLINGEGGRKEQELVDLALYRKRHQGVAEQSQDSNPSQSNDTPLSTDQQPPPVTAALGADSDALPVPAEPRIPGHELCQRPYADDQVSAVPSAATTSIVRSITNGEHSKRRNNRRHRLSHDAVIPNGGNHESGEPQNQGLLPTRHSTPRRPRSAIAAKPRAKDRWDPSAMRWKHRRPLGRIEGHERSVWVERQSQLSDDGASQVGGAPRSRASHGSRQASKVPSRRGVMSDVASHTLEEEAVDGEAEFYRQRFLQRVSQSRRRGSVAMSERSVMPPLSPDVLSPEDAADAHDVGYTPHLRNVVDDPRDLSDWVTKRCPGLCQSMLDLAEPNYETRRIATLAVGPTTGAVAEPIVRLVLVAIISHYIGTDAMVAFVLVTLLVRFTMEELSAAITDTESIWLRNALSGGGDQAFIQAGRHVRLAIFVQVAIIAPVLGIWAWLMGDAVLWLVDKPSIANQASNYARIIVIDYVLQAASRTFMLVFHLVGHSYFDTNVDVCATLLTLTAVAVLIGSDSNPSLSLIAWIQVASGVFRVLVKVCFVSAKGWLNPYREGMFGQVAFSVRSKSMTF
jgi:hypothetical protein